MSTGSVAKDQIHTDTRHVCECDSLWLCQPYANKVERYITRLHVEWKGSKWFSENRNILIDYSYKCQTAICCAMRNLT